MTKNIVVVGAGFAGVLTTKKLAKRFKSNADVTITLIDRHSYFTYLTELHEVATERVAPDAVQYDLQHLFKHAKNVKLVTDNVTQVDKDTQKVIAKNGEYPFDSLVISLAGNLMILVRQALRKMVLPSGPWRMPFAYVRTWTMWFVVVCGGTRS